MSELNKYIKADNLEEVNGFVELGYKIHTVIPVTSEHGHTNGYYYVLSLSSEKAYDNITTLVDIRPDQVDEYLEDGWIVADSWSKIIRMVKKAS